MMSVQAHNAPEKFSHSRPLSLCPLFPFSLTSLYYDGIDRIDEWWLNHVNIRWLKPIAIARIFMYFGDNHAFVMVFIIMKTWIVVSNQYKLSNHSNSLHFQHKFHSDWMIFIKDIEFSCYHQDFYIQLHAHSLCVYIFNIKKKT